VRAPDPATGMVLDLGLLERSMADVQKMLEERSKARPAKSSGAALACG